MNDPALPLAINSDVRISAEESLRNSLAAIRAAAEILHDYNDLSRDECMAFTEAVLVESERLDGLIGCLLDKRGTIGLMPAHPVAGRVGAVFSGPSIPPCR